MVSSNRMAPTIRSPVKLGLVMIRVRISWMRSSISVSSANWSFSTPYSLSALGVLPPLWSRAAMKPSPVLTLSIWSWFMVDRPVRGRRWSRHLGRRPLSGRSPHRPRSCGRNSTRGSQLAPSRSEEGRHSPLVVGRHHPFGHHLGTALGRPTGSEEPAPHPPQTATSSPLAKANASAGGSCHTTGTESDRPPSRAGTVTSRPTRRSPDGRLRSSGCLDNVPRNTTTFITRPLKRRRLLDWGK